ncbi:hypothetical protein KRP22_006246 [Phytophthora ramorum]|nr:hypothetical protein KRP22_2621 [Phytophthora ramorum]
MDNPLIGEFLALLSDAVRSGRMNLVQILLDWSNAEAAHAFQVAASSKQWEVAKMVLSSYTTKSRLPRLDVVAATTSAAEYTATKGDVEMANLLVSKVQAFEAGRALEIAAESGHLEVVKMFIDLSRSLSKGNALVCAAWRDRVGIVKYLLDHCDPDTVNRAFTRVASAGNIEVSKLLLERYKCMRYQSQGNYRCCKRQHRSGEVALSAAFKKRHGLHRSQRTVHVEEAAVDIEVEGVSGVKRTRQEVEDGDDTDDEQVQKVAVPPLSKGRKQFVSADDILLLTQVLQTKPWAFQHVMDGWQQVSDQLRAHDEFRLEKTAGACQARVVLLLDHLRAGNAAALRKAGTSDEYERKRELLVEVQAKQTAFEEVQEDVRKRRGEPCLPLNITQHDAAVAKVGEVAAAIAVAEATGEADRDNQRRLELLEIKMERELAEQRRHADEQVRELERLQRVQLEAQQNQHAQLLATIQQQQAMMLDLIKSVAAQAKNKE